MIRTQSCEGLLKGLSRRRDYEGTFVGGENGDGRRRLWGREGHGEWCGFWFGKKSEGGVDGSDDMVRRLNDGRCGC